MLAWYGEADRRAEFRWTAWARRMKRKEGVAPIDVVASLDGK
jgi:hypothetical protein